MKTKYAQVQFTDIPSESKSGNTNSDDDSDEFLQENEQESSQLKLFVKRTCLVICPIIFFCFVVIAIVVPVTIGIVSTTVNRDCFYVSQNTSLPTYNTTVFISELVTHVYIVIPESSIAQSHLVNIKRSSVEHITLFSSTRTMYPSLLKSLQLNTTIWGGGSILNITYKNDLIWPGWGCPTVSLTVEIPENMVFELVYVSNPHQGLINIDEISSTVISLISGSGVINTTKTNHFILNTTLTESIGNVNIVRPTCNGNLTSSINAKGGEISVMETRDCTNIMLESVALPIRLDGVNFLRGKIVTIASFTNITISRVVGLATCFSELKSGFLSLSVADRMDSTYFSLISGGEKPVLNGFSEAVIDVATTKEKSGRIGCASKDTCLNDVYLHTDSIGWSIFSRVTTDKN